MLGSEMLDVAIGLVLVYLLLSTLASALREVVAYFLDHRAQHLETGIKFLLKDEVTGLAEELYSHPLIREVPEERGGDPARRPINIPSRSFALAVMEMMARKAGQAAVGAAATGEPAPSGGGGSAPNAAAPAASEAGAPAAGGTAAPTASASAETPAASTSAPAPSTASSAAPAAATPATSSPVTSPTPAAAALTTPGPAVPTTPTAGTGPSDSEIISLASVRAGVATIEEPSVRRALLVAVDTAQGELDRAQKNVEAWFDGAMQRVSGWYRRETQKIVLGAAVLLTIGLNVNTLAIIDQLSRDDTLRAQIVQDAEARSSAGLAPGTPGDVRQSYDALEALALPLGWSDGWPGAQRSLRPDHDRFRPWEDLAEPILGWIITIFAVSLGAPFWFNLLSGMIRARSSLIGATRSGGGDSGSGKA